MQIQVNGEMKNVEAATVAELTAALKLDIRRVAIELGGEIVPRAKYGEVALNDGDRIEIVHFIGGG